MKIAILSVMMAGVASAVDLGEYFFKPENWREQSEFFAVAHAKEGFKFASDARDIVNCLDHNSCTWFDLKVWETKVYFDKSAEEEKIARVELSLYNRGDAQNDESIDTKELKAMLAKIESKLGGGRKLPEPKRTALKNGAVRYSREFSKDGLAAEVVWGLSAAGERKVRGVEYLRLTLSESSAKKSTKTAGKVPKRDKSIMKSPNGDVYIDNVPMVDQGQKGYCAAAVAERVLRYYGRQIDEHEIAQYAGTSAETGTSIDKLKETIVAIGNRNRLGFQSIVSMSAGLSDLEDEVDRYNKAAKSLKAKPIAIADFTRGNVVYTGELREAMEAKVLYAMRKKDPRLKKFLKGIRDQVNLGIPVFWGVTLGIFPERGVNPQSTGGHMRLIIGYNDKKREILFSDTWGEGHELKRMPEDWAFAITHDAFLLKPL